MKSELELCDYSGFVVISPEAMVLAADIDAPVGRTLPGYQKEFFTQVAGGKAAVSRPFRSVLLLADENGELKANLPTMFAAAVEERKGGRAGGAGLAHSARDRFYAHLASGAMAKPAKRMPSIKMA